ncbi:hypothetical protein L3D22_17630 [Lysobacter soli]|uniref:hypothetical protein n=1 Tax=Lysobacter soli TaxID=453783 RepID=UPI00209CEA51|nr:hypothetical protein [Lysobacter soli]UTA54102.1 hypothetical protein L3D22_17630 [Lysobacter soli]
MSVNTSRLFLFAAMLATFGIYWTGLNGPFIFDDAQGLDIVRAWHEGTASWREAVFGDASLLFARPIPMASFLLTTWLGDSVTSFPFKLGNLVLHVACGYLVWCIARRAISHDRELRTVAPTLAALAATLWLLHPLHVSTVLYAVQRMAQLSTLFALLAVLTYLIAREQLEAGRIRRACAHLFVTLPLMVVAGLLSKQNAAVAPLLCLVLELAYFARGRMPRPVAGFFALFLGLPALGAAALLTFAPMRLLGGYDDWDFTLGQRLLTQARALMDYVGMLLIPRGPRMGLYTDDFAVSTGLFSPATTAVCIAALLAISITACLVRRRAPTFFAGWFFFLAAHAVESTFLPIEMYYEHRNYLPSVGLLMALVGLWALVPRDLPTNVLGRTQLGALAGGGFALVLCVATFGRVLIWKDENTIIEQGLRFHPQSLRVNFHAGDRAIKHGQFDVHRQLMTRLVAGPDPRNREMARLDLIYANCLSGTGGNQELLRLAAAERLPRITVLETYAFHRLSTAIRDKGCGDLTQVGLADGLREIIDAATLQPEQSQPKGVTRYVVSQIYASAGLWPQAREQVDLAWRGGGDKRAGAFLVQTLIETGRQSEASRLLAELDSRIDKDELAAQKALAALRAQLVTTRREAAPALPAARVEQ